MFVVGIDPGLSRCGYGAVRRERDRLQAVAAGVITTPPEDPLPARLAALGDELAALFSELQPDAVVVERVLFQTNARTAMGVGQASGLALAAAARGGAAVIQYSPNEVKLAVAGYGAATKAQMQAMVQAILRLPRLPEPPDAADALALAICHLGGAGLADRVARCEAAGSGARPAVGAARKGALR
jgi:crossover junction endodeoxyribonuclease RuvC